MKTVNIVITAYLEKVSLFQHSLDFWSWQNYSSCKQGAFQTCKNTSADFSLASCPPSSMLCLKNRSSKPNKFMDMGTGEHIWQHWFWRIFWLESKATAFERKRIVVNLTFPYFQLMTFITKYNFIYNVEFASRVTNHLWLLLMRGSLCVVPVDSFICQHSHVMVYNTVGGGLFWLQHSVSMRCEGLLC